MRKMLAVVVAVVALSGLLAGSAHSTSKRARHGTTGVPNDSSGTLTVQVMVTVNEYVFDPPLPPPVLIRGAYSVVHVRMETGREDSVRADSLGRAAFARLPAGIAELWARPAKNKSVEDREVVIETKSVRVRIPRRGSAVDTLRLAVTRHGRDYR